MKGRDVLNLRIRRRVGAINLEDHSYTAGTVQTVRACHLSMALDCLNFYQQNRRGGTLRSKGTFDYDPRTRFVELLKLWLGQYAFDYSVDPNTSEVTQFINLCGDVTRFPRLFPQSNKHSFLRTIAQVQHHLKAYLNVRGALAWATVSGDDVYEGSPRRKLWNPPNEEGLAPQSRLRPSRDSLPTPEEATTASEGGSAADSSEMELPDPVTQASRECPNGHVLESTNAWCNGTCDTCHRDVDEGESVVRCVCCSEEWWRCTNCQDCKVVDELPSICDVALDGEQEHGSEEAAGSTISRSSSCISLNDELVVDANMLFDTE